MRLTDHVTLNFNNISTAAVFLNIEKAFDTTWYTGLLYIYKLSKFDFSVSLIKLISSFLYKRKCFVSVEALFADDTCVYATERKEGYVLRKLQRGLNSMAEWSKRWYIMINFFLDFFLFILKTRRRRSTSLVELGRLSLFLH
jgi:hypothetical protein